MRVTEGWRGRWERHERVRDALPGVLLVMVGVAATAADGSGWHAPRIAGAGWMAVSCLPLIVRSRWPLAVVLVTLGIDLAHLARAPDYPLVPAASLVALYTLATRDDRRTAWLTGLAAACAVNAAYALAHAESPVSGQALLRLDMVVAAVALGDTVRARRRRLAETEARAERAERTREEEARRRVTEERVRIARELHDVVAHHITLVNAQAGVARHLLHGDPDRAYRALAHIEETSRSALDELRATVGLLRQPDDLPDSRSPLPGLADLAELAGSFQAGGLSVDLVRTGPGGPPPDPAVGLAAYRIVQEALTNTHKHAAATRARVTVDQGPRRLCVTVTDDGRPGTSPGEGTGHGLIGMRERAAAIGGTVTAGPDPEGGFRVHAELPVRLS
ncbi:MULTISPECIES: sensor histidine kinase [Streptomyces]|uniref:histidine kinase n=2 Tax=Streptomyces TaxID=1883 RepID=A0ABV9J9T4_9ACTN